jgi:hypothetical protein
MTGKSADLRERGGEVYLPVVGRTTVEVEETVAAD